MVPFIVFRLARGHFTGPVDSQSHRGHLAFHVGDIGVGPFSWRNAVSHGSVFGRHAKRIPAHGHQDIVAVHAQVAIHDIVDGVVAHVSHVQASGRVWQHGAGIKFPFRKTRIVFCCLVGVRGFPLILRSFFYFCMVVSVLHDGLHK